MIASTSGIFEANIHNVTVGVAMNPHLFGGTPYSITEFKTDGLIAVGERIGGRAWLLFDTGSSEAVAVEAIINLLDHEFLDRYSRNNVPEATRLRGVTCLENLRSGSRPM